MPTGDTSVGLTSITKPAAGTNNCYQVVAGSALLSIVTFKNQRVRIDKDKLLPATFIECHNLHKVKDNGFGLAIAIHVGDNKAELGFVVSIQVTMSMVTLYYQCSTGGTNAAGVPSLCLVPETNTWEAYYKHHFERGP
jgi:hypothetical protein